MSSEAPYFHSAVPPKPETYSCRSESPCRYEESCLPPLEELQEDRNAKKSPKKCPFLDVCEATAGGLEVPLTRAYGRGIRVTLAEPSSTPVVRSEHQYSRDERNRLSVRKHIYELNTAQKDQCRLHVGTVNAILSRLPSLGFSDPQRDAIRDFLLDALNKLSSRFISRNELDVAADNHFGSDLDEATLHVLKQALKKHADAVLRCLPIPSDVKFGKYIGFLDLRMNSPASPLAMGFLVPPRRYRNDKDAVVITGEYSHLFGASGFASSVYVMVDPDQGGAYCAQCCVIMAATLLSDRGVTVTGAFAINHIAKSRPGSRSATQGHPAYFSIKGLKIQECEKALSPLACGANGISLAFPKGPGFDYLAMRIIEAYVHSRCPIILYVSSDKILYPWKKNPDKDGHAVLVVGIRRGISQYVNRAARIPEVTELVVHDPSMMPFMKVAISDAIRASRAFETGGARAGHILMVAVTSGKIKRHADPAIKDIIAYAQMRGGNPEDLKFCQKYFKWSFSGTDCETAVSSEASLDFRISLLHKDDVVDNEFVSHVSKQYEGGLRRSIALSLTSERYWIISCYDAARLEVAWIVPAESNESRLARDGGRVSFAPWAARISLSHGGDFNFLASVVRPRG